MKIVNLVMISLSLVSVSANANAQPFMNLLQLTSNNGMVAPSFERNFTCTINLVDVVTVLSGPAIRAVPIHKPTTFTRDVPNITVAQSLVSEAARYKAHGGVVGPIGAARKNYSAFYSPSKIITLMEKAGSIPVSTNPSEAAFRLEAFMDVNCAQLNPPRPM
jgi:hypothetical protein